MHIEKLTGSRVVFVRPCAFLVIEIVRQHDGAVIRVAPQDAMEVDGIERMERDRHTNHLDIFADGIVASSISRLRLPEFKQIDILAPPPGYKTMTTGTTELSFHPKQTYLVTLVGKEISEEEVIAE